MNFKFEELKVYQEAVDLTQLVFQVTKHWPTLYKYSLAEQFHRAALSISLNIAEGSSRSRKDFQHFLAMSRGSCYECIPIITVAKGMRLITEEEYLDLYGRILKISKMISLLRTRLI